MTATGDNAADPKGRAGHEPAPPPASDLLTVTIQVKTGQIVKIESADSAGAHHTLTDENRADLEKRIRKDTLETVIERAFEAGIACVLGDALEPGEAEESEEEADLRHLLLEDLIRHSPAQRLMRCEVLSRAFLGTVVRHATDAGAPKPGPGTVQQPIRGAAGKSGQRAHSPGRHAKGG